MMRNKKEIWLLQGGMLLPMTFIIFSIAMSPSCMQNSSKPADALQRRVDSLQNRISQLEKQSESNQSQVTFNKVTSDNWSTFVEQLNDGQDKNSLIAEISGKELKNIAHDFAETELIKVYFIVRTVNGKLAQDYPLLGFHGTTQDKCGCGVGPNPPPPPKMEVWNVFSWPAGSLQDKLNQGIIQ